MNYLDGYVEEVLSEPYYGEDGGFSIFNSNRLIKFVGYQGEYNIGDSIKIIKVKQYGK